MVAVSVMRIPLLELQDVADILDWVRGIVHDLPHGKRGMRLWLKQRSERIVFFISVYSHQNTYKHLL